MGVYQDSAAEEVKYVVQASDVRVIIAEDQEQVDKVIEIWDDLDDILKVIYYYPKGLRNYEEPFLAHFPEIEEMGREYQKKHPNISLPKNPSYKRQQSTIEAALEMAKTCPFLEIGGSLEVSELIEMPT